MFQPSSHISPAKAREILKDGSVHGHPLTAAQRGMFGAAAGREKHSAVPCPASARPGLVEQFRAAFCRATQSS